MTSGGWASIYAGKFEIIGAGLALGSTFWGCFMNLLFKGHEWGKPIRTEPDKGLATLPVIGTTPAPVLSGADGSLDEARYFETYQGIIDALPEEIALLDSDWTIVAANDSWRKSTSLLGYSLNLSGTNYLDFCKLESSAGHALAALVEKGINEIDRGIREFFHCTYHGRDRSERRTFELCIKRTEMLGRTYAIATRHDITELTELRHLREQFSQSVRQAQNEERSRIAREIHNSAMQLLAVIGFTVGRLERASQPGGTGEIVAELEQLLGETRRELQAASYVEHPPMLKKLGFKNAVQTLADGFARRTGLKIAVQLDETYASMPSAIEAAVYRIVQEALSNVHRHSQAGEVTVVVTGRNGIIHALIEDDGTGLPAHVRRGGGLHSIRSRVAELGGRVSTFNRQPRGTTLVASLHLDA